MKKLITICLLLATIFMVKAQDSKPTKEQTIAYLDKVLKMSIGYKTYAIDGEEGKKEHRVEEYVITTFSFSESEIKEIFNTKNYEDNSFISDQLSYSNLIWANVAKIAIDRDSFGLYWDKETVVIRIYFSSKIMKENNYIRKNPDSSTRITTMLPLLVIATKAESFKKALERLVEIAKEENKNPFEN